MTGSPGARSAGSAVRSTTRRSFLARPIEGDWPFVNRWSPTRSAPEWLLAVGVNSGGRCALLGMDIGLFEETFWTVS